MKETIQAQYTSNQFDNAGVWTTVYENVSETIASAGWHEFVFDVNTPFEYDGTSNLMIDFIIDSPVHGADSGYVYLSDTSPEDRYVYKSESSGDPFAFTTAGAGSPDQRLFNMKLKGDLAGPEGSSADFNLSCSIDIDDLMTMIDTWLAQQGEANYNADCDISIVADNKVNLADFAIFASLWL